MVTGSTRLYETAGDSRAVEAIGVCMQKLREAVELHGGRVVKTMGDAVMALFPTPNAAAAAAARMQTDVESLPASRVASSGYASASVGAGDPARKRHFRRHGQSCVPPPRAGSEGAGLTSDDTASLLAPVLRSATRRLYPVPVRGKAEEVELRRTGASSDAVSSDVRTCPFTACSWRAVRKIDRVAENVVFALDHRPD